MLELSSSGSVRGVSSNGHPYRDPRSILSVRGSPRSGGSAPIAALRALAMAPEVRPVADRGHHLRRCLYHAPQPALPN
jgi:hypothetical protein